MYARHTCLCLPAKWPKPDFLCAAVCLRLRLMDVEHSQPPTHAYAYINTYAYSHTHSYWSDGSGSERAMHAKGRRTQSLRQKGVAAAVRALLLLLLLLLSCENNKCINTLRTHTKVPMIKWDLLLLYAITVAFFCLPHFQLLATSTILQHFHIGITEITHTHTKTHFMSMYAVFAVRCWDHPPFAS